jgi:UDP-2,3-diacylglucosamine pyrophosphatase LpxH
MHFVVSDLHLLDRNEKFLFNHEKEVAFCKLVDNILNEDGRLVLNGDIFDFTGMTPCQHGNIEFFDEIVPKEMQDQALIRKNLKFRTTGELLEDIKKIFPKFFKALAFLAQENRLIYVPGNHDCDFHNPNLQKTLTDVLGLSSDKIHWTGQYRVGKDLVVTHGNQFDPPNVTRGTCLNPGYIFTSALYTAVMPALSMLGVGPNVIAAIPAVRPEENVVMDLKHFLSEKDLQRVLLALTRLLYRNGYFKGVRSLPGWFLTHNVPWVTQLFQSMVTTERVQALLPKDEKLMAGARAGAHKIYRELHRTGLVSDKATIVLGHTHELDRAPNYVNLGTWIDHLRGLDPEEIAAPEISLPFLKVSGEEAIVSYMKR